ncbi:MAG: YraN family protein [Planctomycetota bacterium]|mgnify:CR=1 FL=1|nr:MAG: YraN family protein [Planctomycetota bacterium]REK17792.1 MAG: YraN family protein [Planctomycetota bacterium]REK40978.1 MAG: YraN family protein [Planctomycetota bacterium]
MLGRWLAFPWRKAPLGMRGEDAAARFLKRQGYRIIARGETWGKTEIDIIAVDRRDPRGRAIVFIEVKTRTSIAKGEPAAAVDEAKRRKLTIAALAYLKRKGLLNYPARFDVVSVLWPADEKRPTIEHFQNAFEPEGRGQMFA